MKRTGNTILITGGGSGIGQALAQRFHDCGNHVIVAGRRQEALDATVAGRPNMTTRHFDVDDKAGLKAWVDQLVADHPALNVLINNAGIMRMEDIGSARDLSDAEATIETNLLGPIRLIDALVDHLAARPDATIVNVTSGLAFVPMALTATYSATKAALHSYTMSLRTALAGTIEVIELVPPGVQTDLVPGQKTQAHFMTLDAFADEVMTLFDQQPTPPEILVQSVKFLRNAEAEGRFDQALAMVNGAGASAKQAGAQAATADAGA